MKILALEFSSRQRSLAVTDNDNVLSEITTDQLKTGPLVIIEKALNQAKINREEIQCLALGIGPGSYTGIRSAIAVAQGWQLARDTPLFAVSSAEILAATARRNGQRRPSSAAATPSAGRGGGSAHRQLRRPSRCR